MTYVPLLLWNNRHWVSFFVAQLRIMMNGVVVKPYLHTAEYCSLRKQEFYTLFWGQCCQTCFFFFQWSNSSLHHWFRWGPGLVSQLRVVAKMAAEWHCNAVMTSVISSVSLAKINSLVQIFLPLLCKARVVWTSWLPCNQQGWAAAELTRRQREAKSWQTVKRCI